MMMRMYGVVSAGHSNTARSGLFPMVDLFASADSSVVLGNIRQAERIRIALIRAPDSP